MISFQGVRFTYPGGTEPALVVDRLTIQEGEFCLVMGETGTGKSTLLRAINGLVPHFSGGTMAGEVTVLGRSTRDHRPRELADLVGYVGQSASAGFVAETVEEELAYTMENLGVAPQAMRRRVEEALDLLGLSRLRSRSVRTLSGGEQQRTAIASVLTATPKVLVLDEPTSALDPAAAEEVLSALARLVHDLGLTVVMAEHRLERVLPFVDTAVLLPGGPQPPVVGTAAQVVEGASSVPPIIELGRAMGWSPPPLSVREARRLASPLRERLNLVVGESKPLNPAPWEPLASVHHLSVSYDRRPALLQVSLSVRRGEVLAVMGRNGSGKTTLLRQLAGVGGARRGEVLVQGGSPERIAARERIRRVGMVPQDPGALLYEDSVAKECSLADREAGLPAGTTARLFERLMGEKADQRHPLDLSEGQRLGLALAVVLAPAPALLLLDEPTRGLDYSSKARLVAQLAELAAGGTAIVVASHDVEIVARLAHRVIVLAEGEIVADGPAREVVCHSPVFAPQIAKIFAPHALLSVDEVTRALAGSESR